LLYVWDDAAAGSIIDATTHESWRVREMAAKVIAAHGLDEAFDSLVSLLDDPVPRVRAAAARARRRLSTN
jgi:HEAT repeat protein